MTSLLEQFKAKYGSSAYQILISLMKTIAQSVKEREEFVKYKYIPLLTVACFGNLAIAVYFTRIYRRRIGKMSCYHFVIVLLAVVDFVTVTYDGATSIFARQKIRGPDMNLLGLSVVISFQLSMTTASCWVLVLLSCERYRSIVHPFKRRLRKRDVCIIFTVGWLVCVTLYIILCYSLLIRSSNRADTLMPIMVVTLALDCAIPSVFMAIFCTRINRYIGKSEARLRCKSDNLEATLTTSRTTIAERTTDGDNSDNDHISYANSRNTLSKRNNNSNIINNNNNKNNNNRRQRSNRNASKTLRNLILLYAVLVWPGRIVIFNNSLLLKFDYFFFIENYRLLNIIEEVSGTWILLNHMVNVFVYAILIRDFRLFLWKLMSCGRRFKVCVHDMSK